jgi:hypothetical protein
MVDALCIGIVQAYKQAVLTSHGRITETSDLTGFALELLVARYKLKAPELVLQAIQTTRAELPDAVWYHYLPIDCAAYVLSGDHKRLQLVLENVSHHNSSLRAYVLECLYFIAPHLCYNDPLLLKHTLHNLEVGHFYIEKNLYLIYLAQGGTGDKHALIKKWLGQQWDFGQVPEYLRKALEQKDEPNPFERIESLTKTYLLDLILK